jgi:hypothetical protein
MLITHHHSNTTWAHRTLNSDAIHKTRLRVIALHHLIGTATDHLRIRSKHRSVPPVQVDETCFISAYWASSGTLLLTHSEKLRVARILCHAPVRLHVTFFGLRSDSLPPTGWLDSLHETTDFGCHTCCSGSSLHHHKYGIGSGVLVWHICRQQFWQRYWSLRDYRVALYGREMWLIRDGWARPSVPRSGGRTVASVRRDGMDRNRHLWIVRKSWCNSWNRIEANADQEGSLLIRVFSSRCGGRIVPTALHSRRLLTRYTCLTGLIIACPLTSVSDWQV